jgi:hypothetical protein
MNVDKAIVEVTKRESRGSWLLWFGLLAPPLAWTTELLVNYSLEEWFACAPATQDRGNVLGMSVDALALLVTTVLAVISFSGLLVASACYRKTARSSHDDVGRRARWMALAGILNGILYTIIIVASYAVPLILETCRTTP